MALFETLTDNFNDNSLDASKWVAQHYGGPASTTEVNQRIEYQYTGGPFPNNFGGSGLDAVGTYDLANSYVFWEMPLVTSNFTNNYWIIQVYSGNGSLTWTINNGVLKAFKEESGASVELWSSTYNATNHRWLRIKAVSGIIYFDTSIDSNSWTTRTSFSFTMTVTGMSLFSQTFASDLTSSQTYTIDNFNLQHIEPTQVITGDASIASTPHVTYYEQVTVTGDAEIEALGVSLADQRQIDKTYLYKVYDSSDVFLGVWNDVQTDLNFDQEINSPGSSIDVVLARNSDTRTIDLEELFTTSGEVITTQDSNNLVTAYESANSVGPGSNVDVNLRVEVWVFFGEVTDLITTSGEIILTQDGENIQVNFGAVNGLRKFHGKIVRYVSRYGGEETVVVTLDSFGGELDEYVLENGSSTTVTYTAQDPSNIAKDALDKFTAAGGRVDYDVSSVDLTTTSVTYTFRLNTILEVLQKTIELSPYDWYWYVGLGDDTYYLRDKPTTVSHTFVLGKHIHDLNLEYSIENMTNVVYFTGGDTGGGSNLFKKYTDAGSITSYGQGLQRIVDHRVTSATNAGLISEAEIDRNSVPRYRTSVTILDQVFNTEDLTIGQLIGFRNFGNYIDALELQIVGLRYSPDKVTLQLDSLLPSVNKRLEDLRRNMIELDNVDTPTAPS